MTPDGTIPTFPLLVAAFTSTVLTAVVVGVVWATGRRRP